MRRFPIGLVWMLVLVGLPVGAAAQTSAASHAASAPDAPFVTSLPEVRASLERIGKGSASWRQAADALRATGRRALIVTAEQVVVASSAQERSGDRFDPTVLAEVAPVPRADGAIDLVLVVVNLTLLEETHRRRGSPPAHFHADLDRILVHEIYGHAVPYLLAGDRSGRCPDPQPGERAAQACSIQRENEIRAELGLGRRTDAGLDGLALTRRYRR